MEATHQVTFSLYWLMAVGQFLVLMLFAWGILIFKYRRQKRLGSLNTGTSIQVPESTRAEDFVEQALASTKEYLAVVEGSEDLDPEQQSALILSLQFRINYLTAEQAVAADNAHEDERYWTQLSQMLGSTISDCVAADTASARSPEQQVEPKADASQEALVAGLVNMEDEVSSEDLLASAEAELQTLESELSSDSGDLAEPTRVYSVQEMELANAENDQLKKLMQNQESTIATLKDQLRQMDADVDKFSTLKAQLDEANLDLLDLRDQKEFLVHKRQGLEQQIARLQEMVDQLEKTINEQNETISKLRSSSQTAVQSAQDARVSDDPAYKLESEESIRQMHLYSQMLEDDNNRLREELETLRIGLQNVRDSADLGPRQSESEMAIKDDDDDLMVMPDESDLIVEPENDGLDSLEPVEALADPAPQSDGSATTAQLDSELVETNAEAAVVDSDSQLAADIQFNLDVESQAPNECTYAAADVLGQIAGVQLTTLDSLRTHPDFNSLSWLRVPVDRLVESITPLERTASALTELAEKMVQDLAVGPSEVVLEEMEALLEKLEEKDRQLEESGSQILQQEKAALSALLNESARSSKDMLRCIHSLEDEVIELRAKTGSGVSDARKGRVKTDPRMSLQPSGDSVTDLLNDVEAQWQNGEVEVLDLDEPLAEMDQILKDL